MSAHAPLTETIVLALAEIVQAAHAGATVTWLTEHGDQVHGVARHLVKDSRTAAFTGPGNDIRDAYLRISGMFEYFLPVPEVLAKLALGELEFRVA
jgi:hypothetical protein